MDQMNFQRNHFHILLGLALFFVKNSLWLWIQHFLFQLTDNRLAPPSPSSALFCSILLRSQLAAAGLSSTSRRFFLCVFWFPFQRRFSHNAMHIEHDDGCVWSVCGGPAAILHPTQSEKTTTIREHNEILSDFRLKLRERHTQSHITKLLVIFCKKKVEKRATKYANLRPSIDKLLMKCQLKHRWEEVASNKERKEWKKYVCKLNATKVKREKWNHEEIA